MLFLFSADDINDICSVCGSDVVETVTFETETWLKFRDETETSSTTSRPRPEA